MMLRMMILRRMADPKTAMQTLCEPAQSKCTYRHFTRASLYVNLQGQCRAQMEHPDQAPAFTITERTPQCGHSVWGTNGMVLYGQINDGTSNGNVKIHSRGCSVHAQGARAKLRHGCTFSIVVIPIILIHVISHPCHTALGTSLKTFEMTRQKDPLG